MDQERQPLLRSSLMQALFPDLHRALDMNAVRQKQERPAAVSGCGLSRVKASGMLGKVLDFVGRGTVTASWETWDLGPVSDPKSPYRPVPQFPHMKNRIDDGAHLIRVG